MNWKPIETAPIHQEVLVWIDGHRGPAWSNNYALVAYQEFNGFWWEERSESQEPLVGVTHWMHLPEPPKP